MYLNVFERDFTPEGIDMEKINLPVLKEYSSKTIIYSMSFNFVTAEERNFLHIIHSRIDYRTSPFLFMTELPLSISVDTYLQ